MPSDLKRIRLDAALEQRVHRYAVAEARPFDQAARRLLDLGLRVAAAQTAPGPADRDAT